MQITSRPIFDEVTLCKHVMAEENAFIVLNSFSYTKKCAILAIDIVIVQIAIMIMSWLSGTWFHVMRWVKYGGWFAKKYQVSSLIQDFVFSSRKKGCIRCILSQVNNK